MFFSIPSPHHLVVPHSFSTSLFPWLPFFKASLLITMVITCTDIRTNRTSISASCLVGVNLTKTSWTVIRTGSFLLLGLFTALCLPHPNARVRHIGPDLKQNTSVLYSELPTPVARTSHLPDIQTQKVPISNMEMEHQLSYDSSNACTMMPNAVCTGSLTRPLQLEVRECSNGRKATSCNCFGDGLVFQGLISDRCVCNFTPSKEDLEISIWSMFMSCRPE